MWRDAMEAADYVMSRWESRADAVLGRPVRLAIGRYCAALVLGVPVAWIVNGFRWNSVALIGLSLGLVLFAILDAYRYLRHVRKQRDAEELDIH